MLALQAFNTDFSLMWERTEAKSFDVTTGHTQNKPSHHALNYSWGEHWHDTPTQRIEVFATVYYGCYMYIILYYMLMRLAWLHTCLPPDGKTAALCRCGLSVALELVT